MPIPLIGQGEDLPPDFGYRGQWILKPRIFLYSPDDEATAGLDVPQFAAEVNPGTDDWSFGANAPRLAAALGIETEALFAANRSGELTLENVSQGGEGASSKAYVFRCGDKEATLNFERFRQVGRA